MKSTKILTAAVVAGLASAAGAQVLYDNGSLPTGTTLRATGFVAPGGAQWSEVGYVVGTPEIPGNSAGSAAIGGSWRVTDDFTVPAGQTWNITQISFFMYQTGASSGASTFTGTTVEILDGNPQLTTSQVVFGDRTTNRMTASNFANIYRAFSSYANVNGYSCASAASTVRPVFRNDCNVSVTLGPGTYWITWDATGTLASGPWQPALYQNPGGATMGNPGANAMQLSVASNVWSPTTDTGLNMPTRRASCSMRWTTPSSSADPRRGDLPA